MLDFQKLVKHLKFLMVYQFYFVQLDIGFKNDLLQFLLLLKIDPIFSKLYQKVWSKFLGSFFDLPFCLYLQFG